jgi:YD repeat-containing protein
MQTALFLGSLHFAIECRKYSLFMIRYVSQWSRLPHFILRRDIMMSFRFKYQVIRTSVWCLILLLMSTLFPTTTIFASPGTSYSSVIAGGREHTIALKNDGTVWTWGYNGSGQLGDGTALDNSASRSAPIQVSGLSGVVAIAAGENYTIALKNDGTVWTWGATPGGSLPVQVSGLSGVKAIAGGAQHLIALKNDETVWTWGSNDFGQLGTTTPGSLTPLQVSGLSGVKAIAAGGFHTIALKNDGSVWTWGMNRKGQLGDGTTSPNTTAPNQFTGL